MKQLKEKRVIKRFFSIIMIAVMLCASVNLQVVEAASNTIRSSATIGGKNGYVITISANFSYTGRVGNRFAKVTSFNYDVSRPRNYTNRTPSVSIKKINVTWGATGFTSNKKIQRKSVNKVVSSRNGKVNVSKSWKKVHIDDTFGITGANISVTYMEKGKKKYKTVVANMDGVGVTTWGR